MQINMQIVIKKLICYNLIQINNRASRKIFYKQMWIGFVSGIEILTSNPTLFLKWPPLKLNRPIFNPHLAFANICKHLSCLVVSFNILFYMEVKSNKYSTKIYNVDKGLFLNTSFIVNISTCITLVYGGKLVKDFLNLKNKIKSKLK